MTTGDTMDTPLRCKVFGHRDSMVGDRFLVTRDWGTVQKTSCLLAFRCDRCGEATLRATNSMDLLTFYSSAELPEHLAFRDESVDNEAA